MLREFHLALPEVVFRRLFCFEMGSMIFARRVFLIAGIYGLLVLLPQYFLEAKTGRDYPPEITHPEYFYGFIGVGVAWQVAFLVISRDPARYRPLMPAAMIEKGTFVLAILVLFLQQRVPNAMVAAAALDGILGVLFAVAYLKTKPATE